MSQTTTENKQPDATTEELKQYSDVVWNKERDTGPLRDKIRRNGMLSIYNFHHGGGTMSMLFATEPYVWFFLGIVISIWVVVKGIANKDNVTKGLSWTWIIMGFISLITAVVGAHKSESHLL